MGSEEMWRVEDGSQAWETGHIREGRRITSEKKGQLERESEMSQR